MGITKQNEQLKNLHVIKDTHCQFNLYFAAGLLFFFFKFFQETFTGLYILILN